MSGKTTSRNLQGPIESHLFFFREFIIIIELVVFANINLLLLFIFD